MNRLLVISLAAGVLAAAQMACGSDDSGDGRTCSSELTPAGFNATTPTVSFARDVVPIFTSGGCNDMLCHGDPAVPNSIYLNGGAAATHSTLVGKPSKKLTTMSYVKAGAPEESFLMRKLDATQCALDAQCVGGTCGDAMPNDQAQLASATRDTVRRWIAQGAKND